MIELLEACCLFFGGFGLGIAVWAVRLRLDGGVTTRDAWESREIGKDCIIELVGMMEEHNINEIEIYDSGFKVKRK